MCPLLSPNASTGTPGLSRRVTYRLASGVSFANTRWRSALIVPPPPPITKIGRLSCEWRLGLPMPALYTMIARCPAACRHLRGWLFSFSTKCANRLIWKAFTFISRCPYRRMPRVPVFRRTSWPLIRTASPDDSAATVSRQCHENRAAISGSTKVRVPPETIPALRLDSSDQDPETTCRH